MTKRTPAVPPWSLAVTAMVSVQMGAALSMPLIRGCGEQQQKMRIQTERSARHGFHVYSCMADPDHLLSGFTHTPVFRGWVVRQNERHHD